MLIPDTIKQRLVSELNIRDYSQDTQEKIVAGMIEIITQRTLTDLAAALPEHMREELFALAEAGDQEKLLAFTTQHIPNFETIARDAVSDEIQTFHQARENDFKE
ncbi:MAG: DUF5663 domain-containing protein [Patescibacteria group bacterium UBA2163]